MIIQTGPTYPHLGRALPTTPVDAAKDPPSRTKPAAIPLLPFLPAKKLHVFSPEFAPSSSSNEKLVEGLRTVTKLIARHCGQKVFIATNVVWLAVDSAATYGTFRDPERSLTERAVDAGELTADALALLGGLLALPDLDRAATALHFAALVGDRVHTGKITLSQSELAEFSAHPQAEDISTLLKLTEILQPFDP